MPPRRAIYLRATPLTMVWIFLLVVGYNRGGVSSQLTADFYASSCPNVSTVVEAVVAQAVKSEARMAASLLRLHFHDCFVQGCDGSVLLDGSSSEKLALPNVNSLRGFDVVDSIKSAVENVCPGTVSCADILALAAQASVSLVSGPSWTVLLGRRDATTSASNATVIASIPAPIDTLDAIATKFGNVGLSTTDVAVLSGGHTIGFARCVNVVNRLYNFSGTGQPDPTLPTSYLKTLQSACPQGGDPNALVPLDRSTKNKFDKKYFSNLVASKGLLQSDQELYVTGASTASLVSSFAKDQSTFFSNFGASMVKMGNINPMTGSNGEVRLNCRVVNS